MNPPSALTLAIEAILIAHARPVTMKWIVAKLQETMPNVSHPKVWNAVHNGCLQGNPPRFMKVKVNSEGNYLYARYKKRKA